MARDAPAMEMPAEHALLGLLKLAGGTAHGYELARHFRPEAPLGNVLHLEPAMLYKHLKKLDRLGWLTMSMVDQSPRPPRQLCHITATGEAELRRWLAAPVARTREIRLEFLVKLHFALRLDPGQATRLVEHQREVIRRSIASLERTLEAPREASRATPFHQLVLELRLTQSQAAEDWLDRVAREWNGLRSDLTGRDYPPLGRDNG